MSRARVSVMCCALLAGIVATTSCGAQPASEPSVRSPKQGVPSANGEAKSEDWPYFRGPNRNGIADVPFEPLDEPEELWKANVGAERWGSPVVADGRLYLHGGSDDGQLHCFDAESGKPLWTTVTGRTNSTPSVADGRVYTLSDDRFVHCVDARSGDVIWRSPQLDEPTQAQFWGLTGSPLVWRDLVIVNVGYGAAVDRKSGKVVWSHPGYAGVATPVLFQRGESTAVAIFAGDRLVARDARTGAKLWTIPWKTNEGVNACDPLFLEKDSKVFVCSNYGLGRSLYDVSGDEPRELWALGAGGVFSSPVFVDGHLYAFTNGLGRFDVETGRQLARTGDTNGIAVLVLGKRFVQLVNNGGLRIGTMNADGFRESHRWQIAEGETWNVPAYWKGRLYLRNKSGDLWCVRIAK